MKKIVRFITALLSVLCLNSYAYAPLVVYSEYTKVSADKKYYLLPETKADILSVLYSGTLVSSDRIVLRDLLLPYIANIAYHYADSFAISTEELSGVIATIATSESGNSKGQPFRSPLWQQHNNPFGIKGSRLYETVEYIDGKRITMKCGFRHFDDFESAIRYMLGTLFMLPRYNKVRTATSGIEVFYYLKECGYFTHPTWHEKYFIPTYVNYYAPIKR